MRMYVKRSHRPCFKSGVFVSSDLFRDGDIAVPKKGRLNLLEVQEAKAAKVKLEAFISRLAKIINVLPACEQNKETIKEALSLTSDLASEDITYKRLQTQY